MTAGHQGQPTILAQTRSSSLNSFCQCKDRSINSFLVLGLSVFLMGLNCSIMQQVQYKTAFISHNRLNLLVEYQQHMEDEDVGFDDWEKEAELINQASKQSQLSQSNEETKTISEPKIDPFQRHLLQIQNMKRMTAAQFNHVFKNQQTKKELKPINTLLKCQKDFVELAKNIGQHFRMTAKQSPDKTIPENEIVVFFEQFVQYLYGSVEWESLQIVKQKIKILKKDKKQEQNRIKKQREKEVRLKRAKQEVSPKDQQQRS